MLTPTSWPSTRGPPALSGVLDVFSGRDHVRRHRWSRRHRQPDARGWPQWRSSAPRCLGRTIGIARFARPSIDENTQRGLGDGIVTKSHGHAQFKTSSRAVEVYSVLSARRT
jgi:hypothetical protein